eukprot:CAMPEP_0172037098 /NCGR_PEP_ID=MMETSP1041-20130122/22547_1 /TAXON_ID=464988 /ORGANISM="Hemiselmis andersenii, Strain CCMP439" /LENGTH=219 /DNA_ID=CAMNT_0012694433 /DNA_START=129 /DNA_END=784 /DNA_ORIENTATION=-
MSDGRSFPRTASKRAILVPETDVFMVPAEGIEDAYGGPSMEDLLVFGEISKFVWYLTPSVHAEARANYIMLQEWIDVYMSIMKVCRSKFNERKMETEARNLFKEVIPDYISVSQKMDFFNFNEAAGDDVHEETAQVHDRCKDGMACMRCQQTGGEKQGRGRGRRRLGVRGREQAAEEGVCAGGYGDGGRERVGPSDLLDWKAPEYKHREIRRCKHPCGA